MLFSYMIIIRVIDISIKKCAEYPILCNRSHQLVIQYRIVTLENEELESHKIRLGTTSLAGSISLELAISFICYFYFISLANSISVKKLKKAHQYFINPFILVLTNI